MYFPDDEFYRKWSMLRYAIACSEAPTVTFSIGDFDEMPDRERVEKKQTIAAKKAYVSGVVTYLTYEMNRNNCEGVSLTKARRLVANGFNRKVYYGDGKEAVMCEDTVRNCWRDYKYISHLWGAYAAIQHIWQLPKPEILSEKNWPGFLGIAAELQQFITTFESSGKAGMHGLPLNQDDIYSLPDHIPQLAPDKSEMPNFFFDTIKNISS
jgi:hypothetical protein